MDRFRTQVSIPLPEVKITYRSECLLMGSCFTDTIGKMMYRLKFPVLLNPFGTLFNPVSISEGLRRLISGKAFDASNLRYHNGLWFSLYHYTGFSRPDRDDCLNTINESLDEASAFLRECDYLLITWGTARVYRYKETGEIVANCHKLPASLFSVEMMQPDTIIGHFAEVIQSLKSINPGIRIIFTLSPVRHWNDGAENNQLSKSILHYSIHEIMKKHTCTYYFPAYEIFMDELRDYRFYAADMLHPSEQASQYIWERFSETWLDETSKEIMAGVTAILKAVGHRPLHAESTNHKNFRQGTLKKIERLTNLYPFLDFSNEIALLRL